VPALSVLKLFGSEAAQAATEAAFEAAGTAALDHPTLTGPLSYLSLEVYVVYVASWFERYVRTFSGPIAGGTSEIQRTVIAERVLGLPHG